MGFSFFFVHSSLINTPKYLRAQARKQNSRIHGGAAVMGYMSDQQ